MGLSRYVLMAEEISDISGSETEAGEELCLWQRLGELSPNFRILITVATAVILFLIMRELYTVLINKEWHPANAKLLTFSIFFTLLCAVFTVLFAGVVMLFAIILIWIVLVIFIVLAVFKRRRAV